MKFLFDFVSIVERINSIKSRWKIDFKKKINFLIYLLNLFKISISVESVDLILFFNFSLKDCQDFFSYKKYGNNDDC